MIIYRIALIYLTEELRAADPGLLYPFYVDDAAFDGSARQSAQLLKLSIEMGPDRGYFSEPAKYLFISDTLGMEEAGRREFAAEGLALNFLVGVDTWGAILDLRKS